MYSNLYVNQKNNPMGLDAESQYVRENLFEMWRKALRDFSNTFGLEKKTSKSAMGYEIDNYQNTDRIDSIFCAGIKSLERIGRERFKDASEELEVISKLQDNWNDNGARHFSVDLIEKCREILLYLDAEPFITPTACGSIQFDYEKENGQYLEFEVYNDRVEVYSVSESGVAEETNLTGINTLAEVRQMVVDFYG